MTAPATQALDIFVAGKPAPQGSKHGRPIYKGTGDAKVFTGKVAQVESAKKTVVPWRADVRAACVNEEGQPRTRFDGPVRVLLEFVMPRPLSTPKRSTPPAVKKPDIDKLQRAVLDAVSSAGVWRDDSQVVDIHATKRLAELDETAGCRIRIEVA